MTTRSTAAELVGAASRDVDNGTSRSGGQPLDASLAAEFGASLGHDFSRVRVHTEARAENEALVRGAKVFTVGEHIMFSRGAYAPSDARGRMLIGHELAHVVQQAPEYSQRRGAGAACEADADRAGSAAAGGTPARVTRFVSPQVQRQAMSNAELQKRLATVLADLSRAKTGSPEAAALAAERDAIMTALGSVSSATSSPGTPAGTDLVSKPPSAAATTATKPMPVKCAEPNKSVAEPNSSSATSEAIVCSAPKYSIPITYLSYADLGLTPVSSTPPPLGEPFKTSAIGGSAVTGGAMLIDPILAQPESVPTIEELTELADLPKAPDAIDELFERVDVPELEPPAPDPINDLFERVDMPEANPIAEPIVEEGAEATTEALATGGEAAGLGLGGIALGLATPFLVSGDTKLNYNWDPKAHKNSYKSTANQYLYVILDGDGQLIKYGTANVPNARYTAEEFRTQFGAGARMEVLEISATDVRTIRFLEARLIQRYRWLNGARPAKNKADH